MTNDEIVLRWCGERTGVIVPFAGVIPTERPPIFDLESTTITSSGPVRLAGRKTGIRPIRLAIRAAGMPVKIHIIRGAEAGVGPAVIRAVHADFLIGHVFSVTKVSIFGFDEQCICREDGGVKGLYPDPGSQGA